MSDPDDDEALSWDGDDRLQAPARTAPAPAAGPEARDGAGGATGLLVLGVLGGVAVLETALWIRGLLLPPIVRTLGVPGSGAATASYWITAVLRGFAAAAPLVWFAAVLWRVRRPSPRLAWLLLGAVLLVPWPFMLGAL
ncbi:hypothetical protein [Amnibacterium endophyticum]|uniref:Uncharacterized protein n=1 Tax=Amnibacterium endophyticum TaxID=2109337 RepID=A0ABW4LBF7_9MICO